MKKNSEKYRARMLTKKIRIGIYNAQLGIALAGGALDQLIKNSFIKEHVGKAPKRKGKTV